LSDLTYENFWHTSYSTEVLYSNEIAATGCYGSQLGTKWYSLSAGRGPNSRHGQIIGFSRFI